MKKTAVKDSAELRNECKGSSEKCGPSSVRVSISLPVTNIVVHIKQSRIKEQTF
jgi:hypothetical protein